MDLVDSDSYFLQQHDSDFKKHDGFRNIYVLNKLELPDSLEIDAYGWGPFKQLVLRR